MPPGGVGDIDSLSVPCAPQAFMSELPCLGQVAGSPPGTALWVLVVLQIPERVAPVQLWAAVAVVVSSIHSEATLLPAVGK